MSIDDIKKRIRELKEENKKYQKNVKGLKRNNYERNKDDDGDWMVDDKKANDDSAVIFLASEIKNNPNFMKRWMKVDLYKKT